MQAKTKDFLFVGFNFWDLNFLNLDFLAINLYIYIFENII